MAWAPAVSTLAAVALLASGFLGHQCPGLGWWAATVVLLTICSFCAGSCCTICMYYISTRDWPLQVLQIAAGRLAQERLTGQAVGVRQRFGNRVHGN